MTVALREKELHRAVSAAYVTMVSQRSGRMLAVGAQRLPMWGGPLPTLGIAIMAVLTIKYVKQLIARLHAPVAQRSERPTLNRQVAGSSPARRTQKYPTYRKELSITENTQSPAAEVTEATETTADEAAEEQALFRRLAKRQWDSFVKTATKIIDQNYSYGNLSRRDREELYAMIGVPVEVPTRSAEVTFTVVRKVILNGKEDGDAVTKRIQSNPSEYAFYGDKVVSVKAESIKLPDEEPENDPIAGLTAKQIMEKIESTRAALREWTRVQHLDKGRWCGTGAVNGELVKIGAERLPTPKPYTVTVPVVGEAQIAVHAPDPDAALKQAKERMAIDPDGKSTRGHGVNVNSGFTADLDKIKVEEVKH